MKVFVVGGTGFLGYHAVQELLRRGHQVGALALPSTPTPDILPPEVPLQLANIHTLPDLALMELLEGYEGLIFAAGADDRVIPPAPAYETYFNRANVRTTVRLFDLARHVGVKRGVVCGSYFVHFHEQWPELRLVERHPYIRSRVEQERQTTAVCLPDLAVTFMRLPYIFGAIPGRTPIWKSIVDYVRSPWPLFFTRGGTNMISVKHVAEAMVGALELGQAGKAYLVGDENVTWADWLGRIGRIVGRQRKVHTLPDGVPRFGLLSLRLVLKLQNKQRGLEPVHYMDLQTRETFFDPEPARQELGFGSGGLEEALKETVEAC